MIESKHSRRSRSPPYLELLHLRVWFPGDEETGDPTELLAGPRLELWAWRQGRELSAANISVPPAAPGHRRHQLRAGFLSPSCLLGGHHLVLHPPAETLQLVHPHLAHQGGAGLLPAAPQVVLQDIVQVPAIDCLYKVISAGSEHLRRTISPCKDGSTAVC